MKNVLIGIAAIALSAAASAPALAQANYCDRSGYATGVTHPDDPVPVCDRGQPVSGAQLPAVRESQRQAQQQKWANRRDERYREQDNYAYGARGGEWRRGGHIPRQYMDRQYRVDDWRAHRLSAPPRGYQWVQVGSDYVLVALATGIISQLLLSH